jgi:itaconate CoA-transferase
MQALKGITIVTLEHAIAAPYATRQLADMGARVIKIERPGVGDFARAYDTRVRGQSSHFVWTNRSKESLTLDVKQEAARGILQQLVLDHADVLVQNLAPGAAARLGLSHEVLAPRKPGLIVCDISGYGADGPYRDKKAYDLLIQSEAGLVSVTGTPEVPCKAGASMADIAAGMFATTSILAALMHRQQTGHGQRIDISMLEALTEWMGFPMYYAFDGAQPPARTGASHATIYPYGPFLAGDGNSVMLGLQNEREWKVFCDKVLLQPMSLQALMDRRAGPAPPACWTTRPRWPMKPGSTTPSQPAAPGGLLQLGHAAVERQQDGRGRGRLPRALALQPGFVPAR